MEVNTSIPPKIKTEPLLPLATFSGSPNPSISNFPSNQIRTIFPPLTSTSQEDYTKKRNLDEETKDEQNIQAARKRVAQLAEADKQRVLHPDYTSPFLTQEDAARRLLAYHLLSEGQSNRPAVDETQQDEDLLRKIEELFQKVKKVEETIRSTISEMQKGPRKEEEILIDKLCVLEDKMVLENLIKARNNVATSYQAPGRPVQTMPNTTNFPTTTTNPHPSLQGMGMSPMSSMGMTSMGNMNMNGATMAMGNMGNLGVGSTMQFRSNPTLSFATNPPNGIPNSTHVTK
eukprot:TRINITY_DN6657_c0_g1_i1.p1 TRINITY_DN6657_c0_g1~~TRINITY_DN6657_c0_g1_i1.p1  ORF type:complete len:288 (+),score=40.19 TRINITY_DN6657_c0_g1_i1:1-864(+)